MGFIIMVQLVQQGPSASGKVKDPVVVQAMRLRVSTGLH